MLVRCMRPLPAQQVTVATASLYRHLAAAALQGCMQQSQVHG